MILYVETNFLVGMALGQDKHADEFLAIRKSDLQIIVPSICVMEALSRLEGEQTYRTRLDTDLRAQVSELERRGKSEPAQDLLRHLTAAIAENTRLLRDVESHFRVTLLRLIPMAGEVQQTAMGPATEVVTRITMRPLDETALKRWFDRPLGLDPTDLLILRVIERDAKRMTERQDRAIPKVFLSSDRKLHETEVLDVLQKAGITHFFKDTRSFLGWYRSLSPEEL